MCEVLRDTSRAPCLGANGAMPPPHDNYLWSRWEQTGPRKSKAKCQLAFEHENRTPNFFTSAAICTRSTCARPTFNQPALLVEGPSPTLGFPTAIVLSIRLHSLVMDKNAETAQSVALTGGVGRKFQTRGRRRLWAGAACM